MKSLLLIFSIALAAGVGLWTIFGNYFGVEPAVAVKCIEVRKGPFVASVQATGRLISRKTETIRTLYAGIIHDHGYENGEYVAKDVKLAGILPPEEIRRKKQTELELAQLDLELIKEQRLQAEELLQAKAASAREVNELKIRQRRQQAEFENLREELQVKPVLAPFAGLLAEKRFHHGDRLNAGAELFTLIDTGAVMIEAAVQQFDLPKIHVGQNARLHSEIFRQSHAGKIIEVSMMTARSNNSSNNETHFSFFTAYIQVNSLVSEELRLGATVEAEIVLAEKTEAISIPLECIHFENSNQDDSPSQSTFNPFLPFRFSRQREMPEMPNQIAPGEISRYVFVVENGLAHKKEIVTGAGNTQFIEVLKGLQEGEWIVVVSQQEIVEGAKLKLR